MTSLSHTHDAPVVAPEGSVAPGAAPMLDIGGDVGAMIVYLDRIPPSGELMAHPPGRPDEHFHTGVHPRELGGRTVAVAIFPEAVEGTYDLLDPDGMPMARIEVTGGRVSELDLRSH